MVAFHLFDELLISIRLVKLRTEKVVFFLEVHKTHLLEFFAGFRAEGLIVRFCFLGVEVFILVGGRS